MWPILATTASAFSTRPVKSSTSSATMGPDWVNSTIRPLTMDNAGNLLVLDEKNFRVQMFTTRGVFKNKFGKRGTGRGEFGSPWGVATDSKRNVFVTDRNLRVQVFDPDGYYITEFGTPIGNYKIAPALLGDRHRRRQYGCT
jgi:DNA-binding beta-propeller fold protein YncE